MSRSATTLGLGAAGFVGLVVGIAVLAGADAIPAAGAALASGTVPAAYLDLVMAAGRQCAAAPAPIIAAQLDAESSWNPLAVSPVGAQGIAQFMPGTWRIWGTDANGDGRADPFEPGDAIPAQARYDCALAAQLAPLITAGSLHGDLTDLMLAAYNAGPATVIAAGGIPQNGETPGYVSRIHDLAAHYTAVTAAATSGFGAAVIAAAMTWVGHAPYVWAGGDIHGPTTGATPGVGFDCSGLVLYAVYQASGGKISLPHLVAAQVRLGTPVPLAQLQPGDVITFTNRGESTPHHDGIYLGGDQMVHAPDFGQMVEVTTLTGSYWAGQTWRAVRFG